MEITVEKMTRQAPQLGLSTPRGATHIDTSWVKVVHGETKIEMGFSKYSTENQWYLDTQFTDNLPVFNHGEGARSCAKQTASGELLEALNNAEITEDLTDRD